MQNDYLLISTCYSFVCDNRYLIRSHIKFKVTHQGQGQIKASSKERHSNTDGFHLNQMRSC